MKSDELRKSFKYYLKKNSLSTGDVSRELGTVSYQRLDNFINGNPTFKTLDIVEKYLNSKGWEL